MPNKGSLHITKLVKMKNICYNIKEVVIYEIMR